MSHVRRARIRVFEETGYLLQTFQIPHFQAKKDRAIRKVYTVANLMRAKEGLPKKTYLMLDRNGNLEEIR